MDKTVVLIGLNHKTAPVEVRERFSFSPEQVTETLNALQAEAALSECAVLSTCNRTEFYAVARQNPEAGIETLTHFMGREETLPPDDLDKLLYRHQGVVAINHLFSVSSGLDSLVVGENQILGQVRRAFIQAQEASSTGPVLERLFPWAIRVGKRARSETNIAKGASSVSAAAVELAQKIFGDMEGRNVLLLGAGKMGKKSLKLLNKAGVNEVKIVNRTLQKAEELAEQCGGTAVPYEMLDDALANVDILMASTGAPHYILTKDRISKVIRQRRGKPLFLIDIAVPRDIDPACGDVDNVYLYNIDDLQAVVDKNLARRHSETQAVLSIVESATKDFCKDLHGRKASEAIVTLRKGFDSVRRAELEHFRTKKSVSDDQLQLLEHFSRRLLNKILHDPTTKLRQLSEGGATSEELLDSLRILGLVEDEES
jgi:glutamyl-tRNA reductase